jgi:spermidine synthase
LFGTAEVVRDRELPSAWKVTVDGILQSYVDLDDPANLAMPYTEWIGQVLDRYWDTGTAIRAVHVGGGGFTIPRYVAAMRPGSEQTVFELDGRLVELVRERLDLDAVPGLRVHVRDGGAGVRELADDSTDLVVLDVFRGGEVATELATVEFVRQTDRVLRANGLYVTNLWDGGDLDFALRAIAAVGAVFPHVLVLGEAGVLMRQRPGNLVVTASHHPLPVAALEVWAAEDPDLVQCLTTRQLAAMCGSAPPLTEASPLTSAAPSIRRRRD